MIRPFTSATTSDPLSRAGLLALRPSEGHGERSSSDSIEQQGIAVQQVPSVAFGGGVRGPLTSDAPTESLVLHPPGTLAPPSRQSSPPSSASAASLTEAAIRAELAAAEAGAAAAGSTATPPADGAASLSFEDVADQIEAKTFITRPVQGDPEATLQKLLRMRDDALDPPASVADLAIATAAAIQIGRLVRDRYAAEQISAGRGAAPETTRPTLPPTSVKA